MSLDVTDLLDPLDLADKIRTHLVSALLPLLRQMGQQSLFNLITGLAAMHTPGVGGTLTIAVPAKLEGRVEVDWSPATNIKETR